MNITKKASIVLMIIGLSSMFVSCTTNQKSTMELEVSEMKAITELATLECYFHNVAKYTEEDAQVILLWKKDKHFWIEYSGIVKIGIDPSLLVIEVKEDTVTIKIPEAKVLDKKVDDATLTKDSFIVEKNSAKVTGEDEITAFKEAQDNMVIAASEDHTLMASAQQRAQKLLEEYVNNIGNAVGKEYSIEWVYLKNN